MLDDRDEVDWVLRALVVVTCGIVVATALLSAGVFYVVWGMK